MATVGPMGDDAYRAAMAWSVLRRIKKRQEALRRRWHELSRDEAQDDLVAIGQELVEAAPLFLPCRFEPGGKAAGSRNGKVSSRNGCSGGAAARVGADLAGSTSHSGMALDAPMVSYPTGQAPEATAAARAAPGEWMSTAKSLLDELDQMLAELGGEPPQANGS